MKNECEKCGKELINSTITIINASCWKCNNPMKVAVVRGGADRNAGGTIGPNQFFPLELEIAQNNGVLMKTQYSKTMDESYLANTCKYYDTFVGNHFLHQEYLSPASSEELECIEFEGEPYCEYCSEKEMLDSIC